jgi:hypothetical protein
VSQPRTDAEILDALRRCAELVEGPLLSSTYDRLRSPTEPGGSTIRERFSTWSAALTAAGLEPTPYAGRRPTALRREQMIEAVATWAATAPDTRLPAYAAAAALDPSLPSPDRLTFAFGSWAAVVDAARAG